MIKSNFLKIKPGFIIIGAQKSGTSYLFNLLRQHPGLKLPLVKEIHYFDNNFSKGNNWYLNHFPYNSSFKKKISGEASPYYFYHPLVAKRVFDFNKNIKLILLLRNPVERAISHINMIQNRYKIEFDLKLLCNFKLEESIQNKLNDYLVSNIYESNQIHQHFSFILRGIYINQIKVWLEYFQLNKNILVLKSEDFYKNPQKEISSILKFIGIKEKYNFNFKSDKFAGKYKIDNFQECKNKLKEFYRPYNRELEHLLNQEFNWD